MHGSHPGAHKRGEKGGYFEFYGSSGAELNGEDIDLDEFLGEERYHFSGLDNADQSYGDGFPLYEDNDGSNPTTLVSTDHAIVTAQRLEEMAKRNEFCDLELVSVSSEGTSKKHCLHSSWACAVSPELKRLITTRKKPVVHVGFAQQAGGKRAPPPAGLFPNDEESIKKQDPATLTQSKAHAGNDSDVNLEADIRLSKRPSSDVLQTEPKRQKSGSLLLSTNLSIDPELIVNGSKVTRSVAPDMSSRVIIEFPLDTVTSEALDVLVPYMYTGNLQISRENTVKVLESALYLGMQRAALLVSQFIKACITESNVFFFLGLASANNLSELEHYALAYTDAKFDIIVQQLEWTKCSETLVRQIISRDTLFTQSEGNVFKAIDSWAQTAPENRTGAFHTMVCEDLRIENMSRQDLVELSKHTLCSSSKEVRRALYNEALSRVEGTRENQRKPRNYGGPAPAMPAIVADQLEIANNPNVVPRQAIISGIPNSHFLPQVKPEALHATPFALQPGPDVANAMYPPVFTNCERTIIANDRAVSALAVVDDYVISAGGDHKLRVFNAKTWECERVLEGHTQAVVCIRVHDGKLVSASPDLTVRVWNTKTWKSVRVLKSGKSATCSMLFMDDKLITGSDDGFLKSWSLSGWSLLRTIPAHQHVVWALARLDQDTVISGSSDTNIRVWKVSRNEFSLITTLTPHKDEVQALAVDNRKGWLFSGSDDGTVCIHESKSWTCIRTLGWPGRAVLSLLTHGDMIIAGLGNGAVSIYNRSTIMETGEPVINLKEHNNCIMAMVVFNNKLLTAGYDRFLKVWVP